MRPRFPLYVKITVSSFLVVLLVLVFLAEAEYRAERRSLEDKFGMMLQHVAQTAALFVDGDAHQRVHGNSDAQGADFVRLRQVLLRVQGENHLRVDQIYTLRKVSDRELEFVIMLQDRPFVGSRYRPPESTRHLIDSVLLEGKARYTPIYRDDNGAYVSGYAPIHDGQGRVVGMLEVDYGVDSFLSELHMDLMGRLWVVPPALLLALLLALVVARSITRAVVLLVEGTEAVGTGRYDHQVSVHTQDELRTLADSFNNMVLGLRERFAMLKFVPRHTRAVIAEAVREHQDQTLQKALLAKRRNVTVLFSDIRGFTALSERLEAEEVIQVLNTYLQQEARIIEAHAGSIDKFIGDAVMAIFEDEPEGQDGPRDPRDNNNGVARAVRSALEIQRAVRHLNEEAARKASAAGQGSVPVDVGIGIASGEVVMGSIGYEERLEFAVIGRVVNLASRLTSVAAPGETVLSAPAFDKLAGTFPAERLENLRLKGIADGVTAYRIAAPAPPTPPDPTS